ncbi:MAG: CDP-alcohol phosphatidyltransferase family protein [Thermoleophilia bacterium]|nr:CDP-alcohol phosphatidyltransferase family protein [Thermoleophilia bacterium]
MEARAIAPALAQLPNALTIARFALVPAFVVLVERADHAHSLTAALVFGVAALTDQVDGYLARRWRVESEFGKYADPLADRLMIDAAIVLLWLEDRLPMVALAVILVRDVVLVAGSRFAIRRGYIFEVSTLGKVATWVLYAGLFCVLLTERGTDWSLGLFWGGLGLAAIAGLGYVARVARAIR